MSRGDPDIEQEEESSSSRKLRSQEEREAGERYRLGGWSCSWRWVPGWFRRMCCCSMILLSNTAEHVWQARWLAR